MDKTQATVVRKELAAHIQRELADAMKDRSKRVELITTINGEELAWVVYERDLVFSLAQEARTKANLDRIAYDDFVALERSITKSPDYLEDFASKTATLVYGEEV